MNAVVLGSILIIFTTLDQRVRREADDPDQQHRRVRRAGRGGPAHPRRSRRTSLRGPGGLLRHRRARATGTTSATSARSSSRRWRPATSCTASTPPARSGEETQRPARAPHRKAILARRHGVVPPGRADPAVRHPVPRRTSTTRSGRPPAAACSTSCLQVLGGTVGKVFLVCIVIAVTVCCLAVHAATIRMMFAMARDNNLPVQPAAQHMHPGHAGPRSSRPSSSASWRSSSCVVNIHQPQIFTVITSISDRDDLPGLPAGHRADAAQPAPEQWPLADERPEASFSLGQMGAAGQRRWRCCGARAWR